MLKLFLWRYFIKEKWDLIVFFVIFIYPSISSALVGQDSKYYDTGLKQEKFAKKVSILNAVIGLAISPFINVAAFLSLKGTVSLVTLIVITVDLICRKRLSKEAVILVSMGIVALYLEQLMDKGKEFSFLGIFKWRGRDL